MIKWLKSKFPEKSGKYYNFWIGGNFDLSYEICGYFDNRPRINFGLVLFHFTWILPFYNKWTDECDSLKYGIAYHNETFWIYTGGKGNNNGGSTWITFSMPWQWTWVRTSKLRKDGKLEHDIKGRERKEFWQDEWKDILNYEYYPYQYKLKSGQTQEVIAKICYEELEWRWKILTWFPYLGKVHKSIEIEFNHEVGERSGSWKGGVLGCSYQKKSGESPYQCLKRMERERVFS